MILYMYVAPGQGQTTPWGWNFDVNRNILSLRSFVTSFKTSLQPLILYASFHDSVNVYSRGSGADNPQGTKFWCQQKPLVISVNAMSFKNISLKSILYFFHDFIHENHSPRAGADNPLGTTFRCQQKGLITLPMYCKFQTDFFELWFYTYFFMLLYIAPAQGQTTPWGQNFDVNRNILSLRSFVVSFFNKVTFLYFFLKKCMFPHIIA